MKRQLERIEVPDAHGASERARAVVLAAFREREPLPPSRRARRVAISVVLAACAVALAAASPPGMAVVDRVREVVGIGRSRGADQWVFLGPHGTLRAVASVSEQFRSRSGFPRVEGWCCGA